MATATKILPKQPSTKRTMYNLMPTCTQMEDILSCKERLSLGLLSCFAFFLDYVTDLRYLFCCVLKSCLRINWIPKIIFYNLGLLSCFAFFLDYVTDLRYLFCCVLKSCLRINWIPKIIFYNYCSGKTRDQNGRSEWSHGFFFFFLMLIIIIIF